MAKQDSCSR